MVGVDADQDLFERFRTRGDVDALGQLFDLHAAALLRVALHLTRDPAAAEDLVQATFLRAIEVRESFDGERPLLPWLVGLLQNRARQHRWQIGRSPDASRVTRPQAEDPVRAAATAEFDAAIDAAIAELPELYRPVLRLHLAYGHKPAEIAHALDRPAATVRSQLARGLEQLRRLLPASFASAGALAQGVGNAAGLGLDAVRATVMCSGAEAVAGIASLAATQAVIGGTLAMKKTILAVAGAVLAVGVLFGSDLVWGSDEAIPAGAGADPVAAGKAPSSARPAAKPEPPAAASDRVAAEFNSPSARPRTGELQLDCRFAGDERPAWGVFVELNPGLAYDSLRTRTAMTSDEGAAEFSALPPGDYVVRSGRGGEVGVEIEAGRTTTAELVIPKGIDVRGRVVDVHGNGIPQAEIWLSRRARAYWDGRYVARADGAGRYFLRSVEPERFLSAATSGFLAAVVTPVRGEVGSILEIDLVLKPDGATIRGIVVDEEGKPVPGARLLIGARQSAFGWSPFMHAAFRPPVEFVADDRGEFVAHGFRVGTQHPTWARAPGFAPWYEVLIIESQGESFVRVALERGATLTGQATDGAGSPVERAYIGYRAAAWAPYDGYPHQFWGPQWALSGASTAADGSYSIANVPAGQLRLVATSEGREERGEVVVAAGDIARWSPVLGDTFLTGRVLDERGDPIAGVDVTGQTARGKGNMASAVTGEDGRFVCKRVTRQPYNVRFYGPGDEVRARPAAVVYGVKPGSPLEIRIPDAAMPTCTVTGRLLDRDGAVPAGGEVALSAAGLGYVPDAKIDPETGAFSLGPLPAGTYRAQGRAGEPLRRSAWGPEFVVRGGAAHDVGVVQMPVTGSIAIRALGPGGEPLAAGELVLEDSDGWRESRYAAGAVVKGMGTIEGVAPGRYRVGVEGEKLPTVYVEVEVSADRVTEVEVRLVPGVPRKLVYAAITEPVPIDLLFDWQRDGKRLHRYVNRWEGRREISYLDHLLPGRYEVTVTSERGKRAVNHFVVDADDPPGQPLPIKLP